MTAGVTDDEHATAIRAAFTAAEAAGDITNVTVGGIGEFASLTGTVRTTSIATADTGTASGESELAAAYVAGVGPADGDTLNVGGVTYEFVLNSADVTTGNVAVVLGATDVLTGTAFAASVNVQYAAGNTNITAAGTDVVILTSDLEGAGTANVTITEPTENGTSDNVEFVAPTSGDDGTDAGETGLGELSLNAATSFLISGTDAGKAGLAAATVSQSDISNVDVGTAAGANDAIALLDGALAQLSGIRGNLGAIQNRFESTIANLMSTSENISAARARIMDADFAAETATLTKSQVMQQAGIAMLAQANMLPQAVLSLLQ